MRIALMADLHANWRAFEACLDHARSLQADRLVFLGDYIGYGPEPQEVVERVMTEVQRGAIAILGNHDQAISETRESMVSDAEIAMAWTRGQLGSEARAFLASLPLQVEDGARLYVHASPQATPAWTYVNDEASARRALEACQASRVFCGHTHIPALYGITATGQLISFQPVPAVAIPLARHRRWLNVIGAVGQSRNGDPAAAYALLDTARCEITHFRVPYDVEATASAILRAGLPPTLAARLQQGG
jgi:diadenosine tetraphosphatase ApaH/serine/threonine PP2A family protein phosphatase